MYFSVQTVVNAIKRLKEIHPFFGITYFTCKKNGLPVGKTIDFPLDNFTKIFMTDIHRVDTQSEYYFQPYKSNDRSKEWVDSRYPSTGLQAINTQTFKNAFIHTKGSKQWGWARNYIYVLLENLAGKLLPTFEFAVWFFKQEEWEKNTTLNDVINKFFSVFDINAEEMKMLFMPIEKTQFSEVIFQDAVIRWDELSDFFSYPPDAETHGARLAFIETKNIGPVVQLTMEPNERLNLITGDNGLGKTFLMECSWWALTESWSENIITPANLQKNRIPSITFRIQGSNSRLIKDSVEFDRKKGVWERTDNPLISGLFIYARVDGSYAVWDRLKQETSSQTQKKSVFSRSEIWDGVPGCIVGLIQDWVNWQIKDKDEFRMLKNVLEKMSPPDLGILEPGEIIRILHDVRDMPTINHRYGNTPIVHTSAGIKRIITLAYLMVWVWNEHNVQARLKNGIPENRIVILIDEIEEHLHPKWQRVILPALLTIQSSLAEKLEIQYIISTHSPLILASTENYFDPKVDRLFNINLEEETNSVAMSEMEFTKYGPINSWLTSRIFNLGMARSKEAEETINEAKELQIIDNPKKEDVINVHCKLKQVLAQDDIFWPRWIFFADKIGVKI